MDTGTNRASRCESSITRGKHVTTSFPKLVVVTAMATTASHRVSPDRKRAGGREGCQNGPRDPPFRTPLPRYAPPPELTGTEGSPSQRRGQSITAATARCRGPSHAPNPVACPWQPFPTLAQSPAHPQTALSQRLQSRASVTELRLGTQPSTLPAVQHLLSSKGVCEPPLLPLRANGGLGRTQLLQGPGQTCLCTTSPRNTHSHPNAHLGFPCG
jgi:hypothetical protein